MLVLDVAADDEFVDADGRDEVAARPERLPFVEAVGALDLLLHPGGRFALQYLHDVRDGFSRGGEQTEVNMVFLNAGLDNLPMLPFGYRLEDPQFAFSFSDPLPRYFCPHEVVFDVRSNGIMYGVRLCWRMSVEQQSRPSGRF